MCAKNPIGKENVNRPVVMLANGHNAFDTRIFIKEARTLVHAGYSVSIIVPHLANEQRDGISIIAVDSITSGFSKLVLSPWRILRKAISQPSNAVFHIHDSDILVVGIILKLLGRRVVYDAHEDTPLQISYQHWLPSLLKKPYAFFYFLLEKFCGWIFDAIIIAEPVIAKYFPAEKTHMVRNFPVVTSFEDRSPIPYANRSSKMVHVGTLSEVRGLIEMLEGVRVARQVVDVEFVLGGKFAPASLEQRVAGEYQATYLSWLSYPALVDLLYTARIGIIIPHPIPRYKTNYPVKLFEFMASGLPVIASVEGEAAAFVKEGECGILVNPLDIGEIANAIRWLLEHSDEAEAMGKRGQMLIFSKYNWENEAKVLLQVYSQL